MVYLWTISIFKRN